MKIKVFVALVATATIIFISCNWFNSKKKETSNPLIGEWKLDSIKVGKDTSFAYFLLAMAMHDSGGINFSFTKDTILSRSRDDVDTVAYAFDQKENKLVVKDSVDQEFSYSKLNDSTVSLATKDSGILFLRRK